MEGTGVSLGARSVRREGVFLTSKTSSLEAPIDNRFFTQGANEGKKGTCSLPREEQSREEEMKNLHLHAIIGDIKVHVF